MRHKSGGHISSDELTTIDQFPAQRPERDETVKPNFEGHANSECGEHRTVGSHRAWCFQDTEWCYPHAPCRGCELPVLRAVADAARATLDITDLADAFQKRAALRAALAALDGEEMEARDA